MRQLSLCGVEVGAAACFYAGGGGDLDVRGVFCAFGAAVEFEVCGEDGCEGIGAGGELVEGEDALRVGFGGEGLASGGVRRYGG